MKEWIIALRVRQWSKQFLVLFPLISLGRAITIELILLSLWITLAFSLLSSAIYLVNDSKDADKDRIDPVKKLRPIASGKITVSRANIVAISLVLISAVMTTTALSADSRMIVIALMLSYLVINLLYSFLEIKKFRIVGLISVSSGFSIRFAVGTFALDLPFSVWAFVLIFQLSMFMLSGKRFQTALRVTSSESTPTNMLANPELQFWLLAMVTFAAFFAATYSGFITDPGVVEIWGKGALIISSIPLGIGLVRFVELVTHPEKYLESDATESMTRDFFLLLLVMIFAATLFAGRINV